MSETTNPAVAGQVERRVGRQWRTCRTHGDEMPNVWGCPECLRELREERRRLREENERLRRYADVMNGKPGTERHVFLGACPDNMQPDSRDDECPACRLLLTPNEDPLERRVGRHPTIEECEAAGRGPINYPGKSFESGGLPDTPEERARFEAYLRGHCWAVGEYDEYLRCYDTVGVRMLYGVWKDRGALPTVTPNDGGQRSDN